ncbi:hypothetical protein TELCIR_08344 [Teladorsagia circumcincta]|uniref:Reverse transcriptase domain-containing protein n=1 Tax=Teladorsagia circumcincta TaxID=45464 RepID=A0A2G9UJA9_TELCI|nr:hypothetical protein TELCIR_08344 [Teladorsagia circumcincta]
MAALMDKEKRIHTPAFSPVVYKSFTKILLNRMECILDEYQPVEQTEFRKNFSCMDNIQAITQLNERSHEYHLPLALVFIDYKKAFDSVEVNAVLNALMQAGAPPAFIHLLEQCFANTSTTIQLFERKMNIPIQKGVRQGDTISPKEMRPSLHRAIIAHLVDEGRSAAEIAKRLHINDRTRGEHSIEDRAPEDIGFEQAKGATGGELASNYL